MNQTFHDPLEAGRDAARRRAWREAFELLSAAAGALGPDDLEALAQAAWLNGRLKECIAARERAYGAYIAAGNSRRAAAVAMELARDHFAKQETAVGAGWLAGAEHLLAMEPESVERGTRVPGPPADRDCVRARSRFRCGPWPCSASTGDRHSVSRPGSHGCGPPHDRPLRGLFARHGGSEIEHPGDGFFVVFDDVVEAVACGVAIQRALVDHQRAHGFAPNVRIGLHRATVVRQGQEYRGRSVHAATRIAALAEGGEILTSRETAVSVLPRVTVSPPRTVRLKGIADPVEVVAIEWR